MKRAVVYSSPPIMATITCFWCTTQVDMGILEGIGTCLPDTVTPGAIAGYLAVLSLLNQAVD